MKRSATYQKLCMEYPEKISKEQLYKICHISKRKASYLLENGLILCQDSGKMTRKYTIALKDVATFIDARKTNPMRFDMPPSLRTKRKSTYSRIQFESDDFFCALRTFYTDVLAANDGLLSVADVCAQTGYGRSTVINWLTKGLLQSLFIRNHYHIPQKYLIDFLASKYYWRIGQKSQKHINDFVEFEKWHNNNK